MTFKEAQQLQVGDKVYWTDPNDSEHSKVITIDYITSVGDFYFLKDTQGKKVEAFPCELAYLN